MNETLERRERLYKVIADCRDDYTRRVLHSQLIDTYYREAFDAVLFEFENNRVQRVSEVSND